MELHEIKAGIEKYIIIAITHQCFQDRENDVSELISCLLNSMPLLQAVTKAYFIWHLLFPLQGWIPCESLALCGLKLSFLWWSSLWCLPSHTQSPSLLQSCYWSSSTTSHTNTLLSTSSKHIKINRGKYNLLTKFVYITCSNLFCLLPVSQKFTVAQSGS